MTKRLPDAPSRVIPGWKKALFGLIACTLFFGGAELLLWLLGVQTVLEREDPFRGFSGLVSVFEQDGDHYRTVRIAGSKTFNEQAFLVKKPKDGIRVFVLGGSSAYGFPWGSEAAFAALLGEALAREYPDRHVEVVNAAAMSYAMHRIQILVKELLRYEPDLLIFYSGHNEFVERAHYVALRDQSTTLNRLSHVFSHSRLYSLFWLAKGTEAAKTLDAVVRRDESRQFSAQEKEAAVRDFETALSSIVRQAREAGSHVLLSTVPANVAEWWPRQSDFSQPLDPVATVEWSRNLASARALLAAGQLDDAKAAIDRAVSHAPSHAETRYVSAEIHRARGEWAAAREAYRLACDLDASPVRALTAVNEATRRIAREAQTLFVDSERLFEELSPHGLVGLNLIEDYVHPTREGHVHIARAMLTALVQAGLWGTPSEPSPAALDALVAARAASIDDRNVSWLFNQGYLLENQQRTDEAIEKYREALRVAPTYQGAMVNLALLLVRRGELEEARGLAERLLDIDPRNPQGPLIRGAVLSVQGRADEAVAALQESLDRDPGLADAHAMLGQIYLQQGADAEAERHLTLALASDPGLDHASISLGQLDESRGRLAEAERRYRDAIAARPQSALAHARLAAMLAEGGRVDESADLFRAALALAANDLSSAVEVARVFIEARRIEEAIELLEGAEQRGLRSAKLHNLLGYCLTAVHRESEALPHLERAAALEPESLDAALNLGVALLKTGKAAEAEKVLRGALSTHGPSAVVYSHLGIAFAVQGKWDDTVAALQKAVELDPNDAVTRQRLQVGSPGTELEFAL